MTTSAPVGSMIPCVVCGAQTLKTSYQKVYCGLTCHRVIKNRQRRAKGLTAVDLSIPLPDQGQIWNRLLARSQRNAESGCLEWRGMTGAHGYGVLSVRGYPCTTHRTSYAASCGPIPKGLFVLHRCDNRRCVEPSHLFLGTANDNVQDMLAKGRSGLVGEKNPLATLTDADIIEIRAAATKGESLPQIAARYGCARETIRRVVRGMAWKHVPLSVTPKEKRHA